jgi:hypothetical protein
MTIQDSLLLDSFQQFSASSSQRCTIASWRNNFAKETGDASQKSYNQFGIFLYAMANLINRAFVNERERLHVDCNRSLAATDSMPTSAIRNFCSGANNANHKNWLMVYAIHDGEWYCSRRWRQLTVAITNGPLYMMPLQRTCHLTRPPISDVRRLGDAAWHR